MFTAKRIRESKIRAFQRNAPTIILDERKKQMKCNINIAFYQTFPQDIVSYIICFTPKINVSPRDIRQRVRLYKKNYKN
jgi:hypothetical protein